MSLHYNINITLLKGFEMENTIYFANQCKSNFCIGHLINEDTYHIKEYTFWVYLFLTHSVVEKADSIEQLFDEFPCVEYDASVKDNVMLNVIITNKRYVTQAKDIKTVLYQLSSLFDWSGNFPIRYYYMDNGYFCYASMAYGDESFTIRKYDSRKIYGEVMQIVIKCRIAEDDNVSYTGLRFSTRVSQIRAISKTYADYSDYRDVLKHLAYNEYVADTGDIKTAAIAACNMINKHWRQMELTKTIKND